MASSLKHVTPRKSKRRVVTFATSHTSILIPAEHRHSPKTVRDRTLALRNRKATPHKKKTRNNHGVPATQSYQEIESYCSPALRRIRENSKSKKPRLVESGAVRVQVARKTNPRRGADKCGSTRLIDQGAVRVNITRHTTPRRFYATRTRIWSPPPSSMKKKSLPQSEKLQRTKHTSLGDWSAEISATIEDASSITTPLAMKKHRSNASTGGHRFRAKFSPITNPTNTELHNENNRDCMELERSLSRTLFD
mmetsp:Transcript_28721/g.60638  ORF Transcript_28721/g.60638 Transcript_28721/m.60638 type:complete len:251 (-) Transcript_28721:261-1013(-)